MIFESLEDFYSDTRITVNQLKEKMQSYKKFIESVVKGIEFKE